MWLNGEYAKARSETSRLKRLRSCWFCDGDVDAKVTEHESTTLREQSDLDKRQCISMIEKEEIMLLADVGADADANAEF